MQPGSQPRGPHLLLVWPIFFGVCLTLLRVFVLSGFGVQDLDGAAAIALLWGLPGQIAFGLLLAFPLHLLQHSRARWLIEALVYPVVLVNVAAFHYQAVFGRLPGVTALYYLREAGHFTASASVHAPITAVVAEVVVVGTLLIAAAESLRKRETKPSKTAMAIITLSAVATIAFTVAPLFFPERPIAASRVPIFWLIRSWGLRQSWEPDSTHIDPQQVLELQQMLGHRPPFGGVDPRYPLCGTGPRNPERTGNGRSVIFLVLESVASDEMRLKYRRQLVMPALNRIAAESVVFTSVKASGSKSVQAMPALFAGIPPQPAAHLLWKTPLNHVEGLPLLLRERGYDTAYFHGGDLSFEHQRAFLRMAGFETIVEFDIAEGHPFLGWGNPDDLMFEKLRTWIDLHRATDAASPYLATLFTLSTHDPYILPPNRKPVFEGSGQWPRFVESLRFLDEQLAAFYQWYLVHEAPRGTLLVITGDHAPHLAGGRRIEDADVERFDVPLVIHGVRSDDPALTERRAAQFDIPATILGLLDLSPSRCDQGLDLLASHTRWPRDRVLYAVAGDQLEHLHVWFHDAHVRLDLETRKATVAPDPPSAIVGYARRDEYNRVAQQFLRLANAVSASLIATDGFAPPPPTVRVARAPMPRVTRPQFISHRGQSQGEVAPALQNKRAAIERALRDGFRAIEIDVTLTRDEQVVVLHDTSIDAGGMPKPVSSLTLQELRAIPGQADLLTLEEALAAFGDRADFLVEVKPAGDSLYVNTRLALEAARIVNGRTTPGGVVMDSFSPFIAESLQRQCSCSVGLDAPPKIDPRWVDSAAFLRMDWIYVNFRQASPALIRYAHKRGLRVLVYTVNQLRDIERLRAEWPDAVITDRATVEAELAISVLQSPADGVVPEREKTEGGGRKTDRDSGGTLGQMR